MFVKPSRATNVVPLRLVHMRRHEAVIALCPLRKLAHGLLSTASIARRTSHGQRRGEVLLEVKNMRTSLAVGAMTPISPRFPVTLVIVHHAHIEESVTIWTIEIECLGSRRFTFFPP